MSLQQQSCEMCRLDLCLFVWAGSGLFPSSPTSSGSAALACKQQLQCCAHQNNTRARLQLRFHHRRRMGSVHVNKISAFDIRPTRSVPAAHAQKTPSSSSAAPRHFLLLFSSFAPSPGELKHASSEAPRLLEQPGLLLRGRSRTQGGLRRKEAFY